MLIEKHFWYTYENTPVFVVGCPTWYVVGIFHIKVRPKEKA